MGHTISFRVVFSLLVFASAGGWLAGCGGKATESADNGGSGLGGSPVVTPPSAGASNGGKSVGGASSMAGRAAAGGEASGGASGAGGVTSSGGGGMSAGASGAPSAGSGSGGPECAAGCLKLCQGGDCMCSCPSVSSITLACGSTQHEQQFKNSCSTAGDCFIAEHYTGCCRVTATGMNVMEKPSFDAFESRVCGGPPICDCAVDRLTTDDGKMSTRDANRGIACMGGVCRSSTL